MYKLRELPLDIDLMHFSRWLSSQRVQHRISEEHGQQVLWVADERLAGQIGQVLDRYLSDAAFRHQMQDYSKRLVVRRVSVSSSQYPRISLHAAPITYVMLGISFIVAMLTQFGHGGEVLRALIIVNPLDFPLADRNLLTMLLQTLQAGEFWRLVTPDFIHFSVLHLVFNSLMFWYLGGQVEKSEGSWFYVSGILALSVFSNVAQYFSSGPAFGGMSGVVYGLVGYCWLWSKKSPAAIVFPPALFFVSVVWLVLGYTPVTVWIGLGHMANDAHLYGLLGGLIWGGLIHFMLPHSSRSQ